VATTELNTRWRSDGFEVACDDGDRIRIAFGHELL
jgi:hypothetical protein